MRFVINLHEIRDDGKLVELGNALLETTVANNVELLQRYPEIPPLYCSGVRFRDEPWAMGETRLPGGGLEQFTHCLDLLGRGWGDCAQLCSWRVGELRAGGWRTPDAPQGERATLHYYCRARCPLCGPDVDCLNYDHPKRRRSFHVEMRRANGDIEDPSQLLAY
jgi:hypothetical protein